MSGPRPWIATMAIALSLTLSGAAVAAEPVTVGSELEPYELEDQFGETHRLDESTRTVLIVFEMKVSKQVNSWLESKGSSYLPEHDAEYIADIHGMPGVIAKMFALPKMRKYPFKMLLIRDDESGTRYPREKQAATVLTLDERQHVTSVVMASTVEEIEALLDR